MMSSLAILQKNYVLVLLALMIALVLTFIMNIGSKSKEDSKKQYIQSAVIGITISVLMVWIHTLVPEVEEISLAPPPF